MPGLLGKLQAKEKKKKQNTLHGLLAVLLDLMPDNHWVQNYITIDYLSNFCLTVLQE